MKRTGSAKSPEPYRLADETIALLNHQAARKTSEVKKSLSQLGFDELNVMKQVDSLYSWLDKNNRKKFKRLFIDRYFEMMFYLAEKPVELDEDDEVDDLVEMHLARLLEKPNETVHYIYETEVLRKRDRAKEAINSVPTKVQKQLELEKALRYWAQMTAWYTDFTSQDAEVQAYKDSGVKYVQRHEQMDDKVCGECRKANGEIYEIDKIPDLPHPRCRRWFTPSEKSVDKSEENDIIEDEKTRGQKEIEKAFEDNSSSDEICKAIINNHYDLARYSPEEMKELLEYFGYSVKPLAQGSLKDIPFENGGGYKINFGKDGIFQYHPKTKSHHGGAYWKIKNSNEDKRYGLDGNEIEY